MLTFFRKFAASPIGIAVFAVILIAFVVTLYEGKSGLGGAGVSGSALATVGGATIDETKTKRYIDDQLNAARRETPELDLPGFLGNGGFEAAVDRLISINALQEFATRNGLTASTRLVGGQIASIPAFNGPDGKFDQTTYLRVLQANKRSDSLFRAEAAQAVVNNMLVTPLTSNIHVPIGLARPYASLLLEARSGEIGVVPSLSFASAAPLPEVELARYYQSNIKRYTIPERRVIKLAMIERSRFDGKIAPSEAEIAAAYKAGSATYAGRETRTFTQIIVPTQAAAEALLAKLRSGTTMAAGAKSLGLDALDVPASDKAAFAGLTSAAVADAAFAAPKGGFAALARSGLGFHVVRVDAVQNIAARPLETVRAEIVAALTKTKVNTAMSDLIAAIEDDINGGATFDDVVKKHALSASATPALTAAASAPDAPGYVFPPALQAVLRDAFQAETGDEPQVASVEGDAGFALYHMDRIVPATVQPLATVRAQVAADAQLDRSVKAARAVADAIVAKINGGMGFAQALAAAGVKLPPSKPAGGRRIDIARAGDKVPPPLALMFSMPPKRARVLASPQDSGWYIVYLDTITPGDPVAAQPLVAATQAQFARVLGDEYVGQFANAVKAQLGVSRNEAAIAAFKRSLTSPATP